MTIHFHKMHGLGNDFVILDARKRAVEVTPQQVRALCDRSEGIGCDQLIRIGPSDIAAVRMDIWNADGEPASACGNATRCVMALTGATAVEVDGAVLKGGGDADKVRVDMGHPRFGWDEIPLADPMDTTPTPLAWDSLEHPDAINVGNPHLVFFVDNVDAVPLADLGPRIETDPAFPDRINVNVAEVTDGRLKLRTWERGAGLTRACGTGACATAVAAIRRRLAVSPVAVEMPGGTLTISWAPDTGMIMEGPATHVFSGEIDLETLA